MQRRGWFRGNGAQRNQGSEQGLLLELCEAGGLAGPGQAVASLSTSVAGRKGGAAGFYPCVWLSGGWSN